MDGENLDEVNQDDDTNPHDNGDGSINGEGVIEGESFGADHLEEMLGELHTTAEQAR